MQDAKVRITIDIFSGRRNPMVEIEGEGLRAIRERLAPTRKIDRRQLGLPPIPTLGYRGLVVEQVGMPLEDLPKSFRIADGHAYVGDIAYSITDEEFEDFVCGSAPKQYPIEEFRKEIQRFKETVDFWRRHRWDGRIVIPLEKECKCAPLYEPEWWNVPSRQPHNNCYNYGCNYRSDSFAQPGYAAGQQYPYPIECNGVRAAAIRDQLIDVPGADNACPEEGHLVALVVAPSLDFHWYRKGRNGYWSHKPAGGAVTNLDNSGNPISDPRTADRGFYVDFCTFMLVKHGHIKIDGP